MALVLHEIGTHHALPSMLGERGWRALKGRIVSLAREGGYVQAVWDGIVDTYPRFESLKGKAPSAEILTDALMHEIIAKIGETAAGRKSSIWRDILAAVNRFLLKMGFTKQINKNELADLVEGALKRTMAGKTPNAMQQWFSGSVMTNADGTPKVFYHGSKQRGLSQFSSQKDIEGAGNNGIYFTTSKDLAKTYAGENGEVYPVNIAFKNPLVLDGNRFDPKSLIGRIASKIYPAGTDRALSANRLKDELMSGSLITDADMQALQDAGYDGVVANNGTVAIALDTESVRTVSADGPGRMDSLNESEVNAQFRETERAYGGRNAYERAKAAGKTKLNYRQWVQVRTPAFKAWFGDWEAEGARRVLLGAPVSEISRGVIAAQPGERPSDAAYRWLAEHPQKIFTRDEIGEIVFDRNGLENSLQHKFGWQKLNAVAAIPDVLRNGAVIDRSSDLDGKPILNTHLAAPITIDGVRYQMVVRLRRDTSEKAAGGAQKPNRFYLHEVALEEDAATPIKTGVSSGSPEAGRTGGRDRIHRLLHGVLSFNPAAVSKVTDPDTGEPMVVYHGTSADVPIDLFDRKHMVKSNRKVDSIDAIGSWFTDSFVRAEDYGPGIYPTYLKIKNPRIYTSFAELRDEWKQTQTEGRPTKAQKERARQYKQNPHFGDSDEFLSDWITGDGFDGVIIQRNGDGEWRDQTAYLAIEPTQIKSAVGNTGAFDGDDPDIRNRINFNPADYLPGAAQRAADAQSQYAEQNRKLREQHRGAWEKSKTWLKIESPAAQ